MADSGGIRQCLTDLIKAETAADYQKALQAANKLIRRYPKELLGYKGKLVALIQLGLYEDALAFIKQSSSAQLGNSTFEHAYVLYRQGLNEAALDVLQGAEDDYKAIELKAQICYKLEKFKEARELFLWLLKNHSDDDDEIRKANFLAVQAQLEFNGEKQQYDGDLNGFEQIYNAACLKIEAGEWKNAFSLLDKAIDECQATLVEEGLTDEQLEQELAFIKVQRAFVLHKIGRKEDALSEYKKIQTIGTSDASIKATLLNNVSGVIGDIQNPAEARKKLKSALAVDQTKLSQRQQRTLIHNNALVLLLSNQREPCRIALEELNKVYGSTKNSKIIHAALLVKMNEISRALEILSNDKDNDIVLTKIHIAVNHGLFSKAIEIIKSLPVDLQKTPAINSLLISSLSAMGDIDAALSEIEGNIKGAKSTEDKADLLTVAANLELKRDNAPKAAIFLEKLSQLKPGDSSVKCRLIGVYSKFDVQQAKSLTDKIFPTLSYFENSVDELEESDWILRGDKYKQRKEAKIEVEDTEIITRKLKNTKRKKKIRLPKNYDPNVPPDPERWLPKRERAAYKKKFKKNRDRDIGRGTQGSANANPNVEFTSASPASPRAAPITAEGPRQQRPLKAQKQKKKKAAKF